MPALFATSLKFNTHICTILLCRKLYPGIEINLYNETLNLTKAFAQKLMAELSVVKNKRITLKYKHRLAGLINFARPILNLPLQVVLYAYRQPHKLYKLSHLFHSTPVPFRRFMDTLPVFTEHICLLK